MNTLTNQLPTSFSMKSDQLFLWLKKTPLPGSLEFRLQKTVFDGLSIREVRLLGQSAKKGTAQFNDKLLRAGDENDCLYLLITGSCLIKNDGKFFAEIDTDHFTGEMSYFNHQPVSADVVARGHLEYMYWDRKTLDRVFARRAGLKSRFYNVLIQQMASRLLHTTQKIAM